MREKSKKLAKNRPFQNPKNRCLSGVKNSDKQAIFDTSMILVQQHWCHLQITAKTIFLRWCVIVNLLLMTGGRPRGSVREGVKLCVYLTIYGRRQADLGSRLESCLQSRSTTHSHLTSCINYTCPTVKKRFRNFFENCEVIV